MEGPFALVAMAALWVDCSAFAGRHLTQSIAESDRLHLFSAIVISQTSELTFEILP